MPPTLLTAPSRCGPPSPVAMLLSRPVSWHEKPMRARRPQPAPPSGAGPEASWAARADADLLQTSARTVAELRAGWLGALSLAQQTLVAGLVGELDDLPHAGAAQLKSAELVLKTLQHAGTTIVPTVTEAAPLVDDPTLSLDQRARRSRARILEANARG
jgi:hypothetical protein